MQPSLVLILPQVIIGESVIERKGSLGLEVRRSSLKCRLRSLIDIPLAMNLASKVLLIQQKQKKDS